MLMLKLSDMLRHQIYNEDKRIGIENEIDYIKNYIELEKIRYGENLNFSFDFPSSIPSNWFIAHSLLIIFFENAFKHSRNFSSEPINIVGSLYFDKEETMHLKLSNSYADGATPNVEKNSGFGLKNVHERLNLLYKRKHTFNISKQNGIFTITLVLKNLPHENA